ncbi:MAG: histidine kinase, partial [Ruthenibacterium sp.]
FSIIIIIVITFVFAASYYITFQQVLLNTEASYEMVCHQYALHLSSVLETCKSYMLSFSIQDDLQEALRNVSKRNLQDGDRDRFREVYDTLSSGTFDTAGYFSPTGQSTSRIRYNMVIYAKDSSGFFHQTTASMNEPNFRPEQNVNADVLIETQQAEGRYITRMNRTHVPCLSFYKVIFDVEDWNTVIGIMCVEISMDDLKTTILSPLLTQYKFSSCFIDTQTGDIETYGVFPKDIVKTCRLTGTQSYINKQMFMMEQSVNRGAFYLVSTIPVDSMPLSFSDTLQRLILVMVIALLMAFVASMYSSAYITKPIVALSDTMKSVQYGNLDIAVHTNQTGEIKELYDSFNYMIEMINRLIEKNYAGELRQKQTELSALQSQINTHFLYNTLDTVNWLAKDYHADDISLIVTSLSSLLRLSLNNGNDILSMEKELTHVQAYIDIQKIRFSNSFDVLFDIDARVLKVHTLKMILQPLVENAIYHGLEKNEQGGQIVVSVQMENENIHIAVKNTGANIDLVQMKDLTAHVQKDAKRIHYGVRSIYERLSLHYGNQVQYYYTIEEGDTIANIIFPRTENEDDIVVSSSGGR